MSVNTTDRREEAKRLIAEGKVSLNAIAKSLGVSRQTIMVWQRRPDFAEAVQERRNAKLQGALELPYAQRAERITLLSDITERIVAVIKARAKMKFANPEDAKSYRDQGGATGLITVKRRSVGGAETVDDYVVDTALLGELRQTLRHLAVEVGDWKPVQQDDALGAGHIVINFAEADHGPE